MRLKNFIAAATFATAAFGFASASNAGLFTDIVEGPTPINQGVEFHFQHNLNDNPGLDLGAEDIIGATLTIHLQDQGGAELTEVAFDLGSFVTLINNVPNPGASQFFDLGALGLIASIQADGILDVTIRVLGQGNQQNADVIFSSSTLTGETGPREVPEPATLAVLGMGLLGLGAMRRRMKA